MLESIKSWVLSRQVEIFKSLPCLTIKTTGSKMSKRALAVSVFNSYESHSRIHSLVVFPARYPVPGATYSSSWSRVVCFSVVVVLSALVTHQSWHCQDRNWFEEQAVMDLSISICSCCSALAGMLVMCKVCACTGYGSSFLRGHRHRG